MTSPQIGGWTDERIKEMRRLWIDGRSASQIARALGGGLSRCAVQGKLHRLGLKKSDQAAKITCETANIGRKIAAKKQMTGNGAKRAMKFGEPVSAVVRPPRKPKPDPVYDGEPVSVIDVKNCHCRWPVMAGEEFTGFCGAPKMSGAYCGKHAEVAFMPAKRVAA
jgi:GcrA cell cycle regulator